LKFRSTKGSFGYNQEQGKIMSATLKVTPGDAISVSQNGKLERLAFEAWQKWSAPSAGAARRDYVAAGLKLEMTWTLIERFQPQTLTLAVGWLLNQAKDRIAAEGKKQNASIALVGGGHSPSDTQTRCAPAIPSPDAGRPQAGQRSELATEAATPRHTAPAAPPILGAKQAKLKILADKQQIAAKALARTAIRLSRLDTVLVFGKQIGNCTVAEVRGWIAIREREMREAGRDVQFARNLIANLPSHAVLREWWKSGDEVEAIYEKAEADNAI
jgi:hypothetical protein